MTKAELRVLRAHLLAERSRLHEVAKQLAELSTSLGERPPTVVELMAAGGFTQHVQQARELHEPFGSRGR